MHPREDLAVAQLESALLAGEERFRLIAENASDLIGLLDPSGKRVYVNPAYERMFGPEHSKLGTMSLADMHPDDRERMRRHFAELVRTGAGPMAEFRFIARGEVRHIESHASTVREPNGRVRLIIVVGRDVTARRVAEDSLRARELQLREAQAIASIGSWEWNLDAGKVTWSDHMYRLCGVERGNFQPSAEAFLGLVHPEDRPRVSAAAGRSRESGAAYEEPFRIVRPDGAVRWFQGRSHADLNQAGQPLRIVGVLQDITDRHRIELELRARELQDETAHALAALGSWEIDFATGERAWSDQLCRILGIEREALPRPDKDSLLQVVHPDDHAKVIAAQQAALRGEDAEVGPFRIVHPDGTLRTVRSRAQVLRDENGKPLRVTGFLQDVTERVQAAEALRNYAEQLLVTSRRVVEVQESERRQLAAELHDRVGPNLTALGINLQLVEQSLPPELRRLVAGTLRDSARLVEETVAVTRDVMAELRPQSLDEYGLVVALRVLGALFTKRSGVPVRIEASDGPSRGSRAADLAFFRIAQEALNNVAKHAQATRVGIRYVEDEEALRLEVEDDGKGLDLGQLEAGGGWGLLIMRERAASIGARFEVQSESGTGVRLRVTLELPAASQP
jgi:PAS domain S-box-containing protein